ncbi:MAG: hypothetical protein U9R08_03165 [Nanoarchaeota archaeon]|nr:hypothetical protein [Nanoarchaeota archaeon]
MVRIEKIIAIVPNLKIKKLLGFSVETYTLVVTESRSIFAFLTSAMLKEQIAEVRKQAKAEGKGFFGQWGAQLKAAFTYAEKYRNMDPEQILTENPKNFEVANSAVEKVKIRMINNYEQTTNYRVTLKTVGKKYVFETPSDSKVEFKKAYGDKVA